MEKLKQFIDDNYNEFSNLGDSEVIEYDLYNFDDDVVEYLKAHYRFDYRDICVYYVDEKNEIWVEFMG